MSQNQSNPDFNKSIHEDDNKSQKIRPPVLELFSSSEFFQNEIQNYISQKIHEIKEQYNIKEESITLFYEILNSHTLPDNISSDQYIELFKLMHIFKIKSIPQFNNVNTAIDLIINQQSLSDNFLSNDILSVGLEKFLTDNIDKCFENEKFGQLKISAIYRIIYKCDNKRVLSDKLSNFIINSIEERFVLFSLINLKDLSDENFNGLFDFYQNLNNPKKEIYFEQLSRDLLYIKELKDRIKDLENENDRIKTKVKRMPYSIIQYYDSNDANESKEQRFKGILYHLKKNNEEDYMAKKIVDVTASSVRSNEPKESPFYVIDFNENTRFVSENQNLEHTHNLFFQI